MEWLIAIVVLLVLVAVWAVASYNRFVAQRNVVKNAWANIDTELRRRYDLIPNLVETVRGYAAHEKETFENVTRARAMAVSATGSPAEQAAAEGPFVAALRQLLVVAEAYPDLKANQNFLQLQDELAQTEGRLAQARQIYNDTVRGFNQRVQSFPSMIIAGLFGFKAEEFFEIDEGLRGDAGVPKVDFSPGAPSPAPTPAPAASAPPAPEPATDVPEPPAPTADDAPPPPA
ncbi:MAG TPA: LemA family protein [Actinomycetota bacterium]